MRCVLIGLISASVVSGGFLPISTDEFLKRSACWRKKAMGKNDDQGHKMTTNLQLETTVWYRVRKTTNLLPLRFVDLGELVPIAVDLVERGRVFWQRWRGYRAGRYRWLLVRFVATVDARGNGSRADSRRSGRARPSTRVEWIRLKVSQVSTGRREDRLHRWDRWTGLLRWRRCTHIFIIF